MDVLSDILQSLRLGGGVYFRCEFSAPWGMDIKRTVLPEFHVIVRGTCWLRMKGLRKPLALHGGDVVAFPHCDAHAILDSPDGKPVPAEKIIEGQSLENYGPVRYGGRGLAVTMLCGYFRFDQDGRHPFIAALPSLIHIRAIDSHDFAWLHTTLNFMVQEALAARTGSEAVVNRLAEVLFIQMVRAHVQQSGTPTGFLAALANRRIGTALGGIHQTPAQPWTLAKLAKRAGMSRSAFAARFNELVEQTPMKYLTFWRMQKAKELLRDTPLSTAAVAERVGYQSDAAFSRVFKKTIGMGPGAYRRGIPAA